MLKAADVARLMNCSLTAAYKLMLELGPVRFGKRGIRLPEARLTSFVEAQRRRVEAGQPLPEHLQRALEKAQRPSEPPALPKDQSLDDAPAQARRRTHAVTTKIPRRLQRALEKARRPSDPPPATR
jgi:hypothetical protein